jgi:ABC-type nitrate/sulfonate/bicarbonate transport system permease component
VWPPIVVMGSFLILWQVAVMLFEVPQYILPSPVDIGREFGTEWPRVLDHAWSTLSIMLIGFVAGSVTGILIAMALHMVPFVRAGFYPLLVLTQNVPVFVLINLFVIWFGFGVLPRLLLLVLVCFFPVAVAMLSGFAQVDPRLKNYMLMLGASRGTLFRQLEFPSALLSLFSGLKITASYCVISAIYAESTGADKGLGKYIQLAFKGWQTSRLFVGIITIIVLSLLLFAAISWLEHQLTRWQRARGSSGGSMMDAEGEMAVTAEDEVAAGRMADGLTKWGERS